MLLPRGYVRFKSCPHALIAKCQQAKLAEAKESLEETLKVLNEAKARLREVEEGIASLQAKYEECVAKKQELGDKCDLCTARLERAEKVEYGKPCMHIYMTRSGIIIHIRTQKLKFCVVYFSFANKEKLSQKII